MLVKKKMFWTRSVFGEIDRISTVYRPYIDRISTYIDFSLQAFWCSRKYAFYNLVHKTSSKKTSKQECLFVIFVQSSCPKFPLNVSCNALHSSPNTTVHTLWSVFQWTYFEPSFLSHAALIFSIQYNKSHCRTQKYCRKTQKAVLDTIHKA
jgi:hypothetical protein